MRKSAVKRLTACLLAFMLVMGQVAVADPDTTGPVFSPVSYLGGYSVTFLDQQGQIIHVIEDVPFEEPLATHLETVWTMYPEYRDALWSKSGSYLVMNNTEVRIVEQTAAARAEGVNYATLQEAIDAAPESGTVYQLRDLTESVTLAGRTLTLDMGGHTLRGPAEGQRPYTQEGGSVIIEQGTLTGVMPGANGGAVAMSQGKLTLRRVTVKESQSGMNGGGIYADGVLTLEDCRFMQNTAKNGGGVYAVGTSMKAVGCGWTENVGSRSGGGLYTEAASATLEGCTLAKNRYMSYGGGLYFDGDSLTMTNCEVSDNQNTNAKDGLGGGIHIDGRNVQITGSRVLRNRAHLGGAGLNGRNSQAGNWKISNTTIDGNVSTQRTGGIDVRTSGPFGLYNCVISNNQGGQGNSAGGLCTNSNWAYGDDGNAVWGNITLSGCRIEGNSAVRGSGAISADGHESTYLLIYKTVITDNTGGSGSSSGCVVGGVESSIRLYLEESRQSAVYGNWASNGTQAADICNLYGGKLYLTPANQMIASGHSFDGWTWIGLNTSSDSATANVPLGEGLSGATGSRAYFAGIQENVAMNATQAVEYMSLQEAVNGANAGDTLKLIAKDSQGRPRPVAEKVTLAQGQKGLTLNLNDHIMAGGRSNHLTVSPGAELTLTGAGHILASPGYMAVIIQGSLIVDGAGMTVDAIEHDGEALSLRGQTKIGAIRLHQDKIVNAGAGITTDGLVFTLDEDVLKALNNAYRMNTQVVVPLIQAEDGSLDPSLVEKTTIEGANGYVRVGMLNGQLTAYSQVFHGVYLDGKNGDDAHDGLSYDRPVRSFERALQCLNELLASSALSDAAKRNIEGIYVTGEVTVNASATWSLPSGMALIRYPDYKGYLINVRSGELTLRNITVDGASTRGFSADRALVYVSGGAVLNIAEGAALQNNEHLKQSGSYLTAGGAVYAQHGTINMTGGRVSHCKSWYGGGVMMYSGTLNMSAGEITGNAALSNSNEALGGGVAALGDSHVNLSGSAVITDNESEFYGGGVMLGGYTTASNGNTRMTMTGGSVSGNTAAHNGGGIFIQCGTQATITGGHIERNVCKGGGIFGGGGIYVNGTRAGIQDGVLYLRDVLVTRNAAGSNGSGFAGCGTSTTYVYMNNGSAIFDNAGGKELYVDVTNANGGEGPFVRISQYMLGGGEYNWLDKGVPVPVEKLYGKGRRLSLNNAPSQADKQAAMARAKVWITDNTSGSSGGGIGSNGTMIIGTVSGGDWQPEIGKVLTGRDLAAGEFSFQLLENGKVLANGVNEAASEGQPGRIVFDTMLHYTEKDIGTKHTYVIAENTAGLADRHVFSVGEPFLTFEVMVVQGPNGSLIGQVIGETKPLVLTNAYTPETASLTLPVHKAITGEVRPSEETFRFRLEAVTANAPMPASDTIMITGPGDSAFAPITFTRAGVYAYTLRELAGNAPGYRYDEAVHTVTVTVTDEGGRLSVAYQVDGAAGGDVTFINSYEAEPTPSATPVPTPAEVPETTPTVVPGATPTPQPNAPTATPTATPEVTPDMPTPSPTPIPTPVPDGSTVSIYVTKFWSDDEEAVWARPQSITLNLQRRMAGETDFTTIVSANVYGEGDQWSFSFRGMPANAPTGEAYEYRVREEAVPGYETTYDDETNSIYNRRIDPVPEQPEETPVPEQPPRTPPRGVVYDPDEDEWIFIDDYDVPLGLAVQTGDDDNLALLLGGAGLLLVMAAVLALVIRKRARARS